LDACKFDGIQDSRTINRRFAQSAFRNAPLKESSFTAW
jgi:hypothetical protein